MAGYGVHTTAPGITAEAHSGSAADVAQSIRVTVSVTLTFTAERQ